MTTRSSFPDRATRRRLARAAGRVALHRAAARTVPAGLRDALSALVAEERAVEGPALRRWLEAEGVGALLSADLLPWVAPEQRAQLRDLATRTRRRGAALSRDRSALQAAMAAVGVPWRPLKGAWSAQALYARPEERPMADTDLLVPTEHSAAAERALHALGFRAEARTWKHTVWRRATDLRVVDARGEHPDNPRPVETHPELGESFRALWFRLPTADASWPAARAAHLLAHATVDALAGRLRLVTLVDVALLLEDAPPAHLAQLAAWGARPGAARFLWPAIELAQRELGAPHSPELDALGLHARAALRAWVAGRDVDAVSRAARHEIPRAWLEVQRIWPEDLPELGHVLRFQLLPSRWELADRHPRRAAGPWWPLLYIDHLRHSLRVAVRRWRTRRRAGAPPGTGGGAREGQA